MFLAAAGWCLFVPAAVVSACPIQGTISAVGTAEEVGTWNGYLWYEYTYTVEWSDFDYALSHVSLLQLPGCAAEDHLYLFPTDLAEPYDGRSTGEDWEVGDPVVYTILYDGSFRRTGGDPSLDPDVSPPELPVIQFEPREDDDEPGNNGIGQFSFIANIVPTTGILEGYVLGKHDGMVAVGNLSGAYPSCTPTPEPATMALLGLGLGAMLLARKK